MTLPAIELPQLSTTGECTKSQLINYNKAEEAARLLNAVSHKLRRELLQIIKNKGIVNVTELFLALRLQQAVASRHLALLKNEGIIISKRKGKNIFYTLNEERIASINNCLDSMTQKNKD